MKTGDGKIMILIFKDSEKQILDKIMTVLAEESQITEVPTKSVPNLSFPGLTILLHQWKVLRNDLEIPLTHFEFSTLSYLAGQPGRIFTKEQIYRHVYREEPQGEIDNLIYCIIRSLRKKLESDPRNPRYIITVRGVGYKFMK